MRFLNETSVHDHDIILLFSIIKDSAYLKEFSASMLRKLICFVKAKRKIISLKAAFGIDYWLAQVIL